MTGEITEDDESEQPFRVKLKNGKLSWFKEAWLEDGCCWGFVHVHLDELAETRKPQRIPMGFGNIISENIVYVISIFPPLKCNFRGGVSTFGLIFSA